MNVLVTAGPTREPIDPVRFISNRSTGKMGYALARAAGAHGHDVVLLSGPTALEPPQGVRCLRVTTADEMLRAVSENLAWCDALVMAAAVADWRPVRVADNKLKKRDGPPEIVLEPTVDILSHIASTEGSRIVVGFAAETQSIRENARRKLTNKHLDMIVANDIARRDAGFEVDTNKVLLIEAGGKVHDLPLMSKDAVAAEIIRWLESAYDRGAQRR